MSMGYDDDDPRGDIVRERLRTGYYGTGRGGSIAFYRERFRRGALGNGTIGNRYE